MEDTQKIIDEIVLLEPKKVSETPEESTPNLNDDNDEQETPAPVSTEYMQYLSFNYNTLRYVFQYLKVPDLLRASSVCTMWRRIASDSKLWRTVRVENFQIRDVDGLSDALEHHGTTHLDLRKMILPTNEVDMWPQFSTAMQKVNSLKKIELCQCPAIVVEQLALSNPKLEVINANYITCDAMSLTPFMHLKNLQELYLKSSDGFTLTSDLTALSDLKQLKCLSLTSIKLLHNLNIGVIADLKYLKSLDLGECTDFPRTFGTDILDRLKNLEKLRLEGGKGNCNTFEILAAVKNMPKLEQLELVNFDIKTGFDTALGACKNIKKLLIIPTYGSHNALENLMVLDSAFNLENTLTHLVWGFTLEFLRVTRHMFIMVEKQLQKDAKNAEGPKIEFPWLSGDLIAVLMIDPSDESDDTGLHLAVVPLVYLQEMFPKIHVKILKIPFHATWRQSIADSEFAS